MATTTDMTFDEMLDTLTGFDELAIKQGAGATIVNLLRTDETHAIRSVIAIHLMREDNGEGPKAYKAAYGKAQALPFKEVRTYFAEPVEEFDPSNPDSASGKGD